MSTKELQSNLDNMERYNQTIVNGNLAVLNGENESDFSSNQVSEIERIQSFYNDSNKVNNKIISSKSKELTFNESLKQDLQNDVDSLSRILELSDNENLKKNLNNQKLYTVIGFLLVCIIFFTLHRYKLIGSTVLTVSLSVSTMIFFLVGLIIIYRNRNNKVYDVSVKSWDSDSKVRQLEIENTGFERSSNRRANQRESVRDILAKLESLEKPLDRLFFILKQKQQEAIENKDYNAAAYYTDLITYYTINPTQTERTSMSATPTGTPDVSANSNKMMDVELTENDVIKILEEINDKEQEVTSDINTEQHRKDMADMRKDVDFYKKELNRQLREKNRLLERNERRNEVADDNIDFLQDRIDKDKELLSTIKSQIEKLNYNIQDNIQEQHQISSTNKSS